MKVLKPETYRVIKVEPNFWYGIHVGYDPADAFRCYIPELGRVLVSKNVKFIEKLYRHPSTVAFDVGNTLNKAVERLQDKEVRDEDKF